MAFAAIATTSAASANTSSVTTGGINTTGANLIVVHASSYAAGGTPTLSDSKSNTWTGLTVKTSTNSRSRLFYCYNPTVGSGHTFSLSAGASYPAISVAAFSGAVTSPFDQESGASTNSNVTTLQPGSITPSQANCLLIAGVGNSGSSLLIDSGFTVDSVNYGGGTNFASGIAYKIQTSAAAVNPAWSWTTASDVAAAMASFKALATFNSSWARNSTTLIGAGNRA